MRTPDPEFSEKTGVNSRSQLIANRFDSAAGQYDAHAKVQRESANQMSILIEELTSNTTIIDALEIGCGTGFLTELVTRLLPTSNWLITDLAPEMLNRCQAKLEQGRNDQQFGSRRFQLLDGQAANCEGQFDLICSNLTFQWFESLDSAVSRLADKLKPNGVLIFNLLGSNSFAQWRNAAAISEFVPQPPKFPSAIEIQSHIEQALEFLAPRKFQLSIGRNELNQQHDGLRAFLRSLKCIGANTKINSSKNPVSKLRAWIRQVATETQQIDMNYEIFNCCITRVATEEIIPHGRTELAKASR